MPDISRSSNKIYASKGGMDKYNNYHHFENDFIKQKKNEFEKKLKKKERQQEIFEDDKNAKYKDKLRESIL